MYKRQRVYFTYYGGSSDVASIAATSRAPIRPVLSLDYLYTRCLLVRPASKANTYSPSLRLEINSLADTILISDSNRANQRIVLSLKSILGYTFLN